MSSNIKHEVLGPNLEFIDSPNYYPELKFKVDRLAAVQRTDQNWTVNEKTSRSVVKNIRIIRKTKPLVCNSVRQESKMRELMS